MALLLNSSGGGIRRRSSSEDLKEPEDDSADSAYIQVDRFISLLQECSNSKALAKGKMIHARIQASNLSSDRLLANLLIQMYGRCGSPHQARTVFKSIQDRNVYSWTILIKALVENDELDQALQLYREMCLDGFRPNNVTFVNVLGACSSIAQARLIHSHIDASGFSSDLNLLNALVFLYGRLDRLPEAERIFHSIPNKDVVSWNAMIAVYAQNGHPSKSLEIFLQEMDLPADDITFISLLDACAALEDLQLGKSIHEQASQAGFEKQIAVANALINMYGKSRSTGEALKMFSKMREKNVISWTGMISAYAQNGFGREALDLFKKMNHRSSGVQPNDVTLVTILDACFGSATLAEGRWIHSLVQELGLESDIALMNAVVNMYSKCGSIEQASISFHKMDRKNVVTWSSMIAAYARFGSIQVAFDLFREIVQEGGEVDDVTFINLMTACSHCGKLEEAWEFFMLMKYDFAIEAVKQHYVCVVDLLSRSGRLVEANELLQSMPFHPDIVAWTNFLSACGAYSNLELAAEAADRVSDLEEDCSAAYILLANIYASAGRLDDAERVRKEMLERGLKILTESSFIWLSNKSTKLAQVN